MLPMVEAAKIKRKRGCWLPAAVGILHWTEMCLISIQSDLTKGRRGPDAMLRFVCLSAIAIVIVLTSDTHMKHTHTVCEKKAYENPVVLPSFGKQFSFPFRCTKCSQSFLYPSGKKYFWMAKINKMLFIENCYRLGQTRILILLPSCKFRGSLKARNLGFFYVGPLKRNPLKPLQFPTVAGQHYDKMCI